jgi:hypothetical protein
LFTAIEEMVDSQKVPFLLHFASGEKFSRSENHPIARADLGRGFGDEPVLVFVQRGCARGWLQPFLIRNTAAGEWRRHAERVLQYFRVS